MEQTDLLLNQFYLPISCGSHHVGSRPPKLEVDEMPMEVSPTDEKPPSISDDSISFRSKTRFAFPNSP